MSIDPELLKILVCPESHQPLSMGDDDALARVREECATGQLKTEGGRLVEGPVDGLLIRADGQVAYLIEAGVPNLLVDERVQISTAP